MSSPHSKCPDILVVGAGIIGLSIALELHRRGAQVTVIERRKALGSASTAAAGMLAADDPHNPPELHEISSLSLALYGKFLTEISTASGLSVPYQTLSTLQYFPGKTPHRLDEQSLDPRQLAAALLAAVRASSIVLVENVVYEPRNHRAAQIIYATGAFPLPAATMQIPIFPRKGQMLRIELPRGQAFTEVHRSDEAYFVPRTLGPQAGSALIGSTIEDAGFDLSVEPAALARLRQAIADLAPALSFCRTAPQLEAWAGLRPTTPDELPLIGRLSASALVATGHFRNGILLAPATAMIVADLAEHKMPPCHLTPFSPLRFQGPAQTSRYSDDAP